MEVLEFLQEHLRLIVEIAIGIIVLLAARKHLFSYIRARIQKMNTEQEVDHFKILRNEFADINTLLVSEQKKSQELRAQIRQLEETVHQLTEQLKLYTTDGTI